MLPIQGDRAVTIQIITNGCDLSSPAVRQRGYRVAVTTNGPTIRQAECGVKMLVKPLRDDMTARELDDVLCVSSVVVDANAAVSVAQSANPVTIQGVLERGRRQGVRLASCHSVPRKVVAKRLRVDANGAGFVWPGHVVDDVCRKAEPSSKVHEVHPVPTRQTKEEPVLSSDGAVCGQKAEPVSGMLVAYLRKPRIVEEYRSSKLMRSAQCDARLPQVLAHGVSGHSNVRRDGDRGVAVAVAGTDLADAVFPNWLHVPLYHAVTVERGNN